MAVLVILLFGSFASLSHSAALDALSEKQVYRLNAKFDILYDLITKDCPGYLQGKREEVNLQNIKLKILTAEVQKLEQKLFACLQKKSKVSSTPSATPTTTPTPSCPSYDGDSVFNIQLINYHNPTNQKASGMLCNPDGSPCTIFLEICVSPIGSSSCEFYYQVTDVVGDQSKISIPYHLGNMTNPLNINLGNRKWQGANVHITALQGNPANSSGVYQEVDKFSYDLFDVQGSHHRLLTLHGLRFTDKTELMVMFTVPCPSPSVTTATTTTLPTTTSSSVPAECLTATNLTQSWRLDHSGKDIKGGGSRALNGYACDWRRDMGWFRFTGAAGTHMLDTCPKWKSCGTQYPFWSDDTPPQAVGITANRKLYQVVGDNCTGWSGSQQVMRCSLNTDHDVIYRYVNDRTGTCDAAFCGMN